MKRARRLFREATTRTHGILVAAWLWTAVLPLTLDACKKGKEEHKATSSPAVAPQPVRVTDSTPSGPAYFAVQGRGIVRLTEGRFTVVSSQPRMVETIVEEPGGALWMLGPNEIYRLHGDQIQKLGDKESPGTMWKIAVRSRGDVWATGKKTIAHYDGERWKVGPLSQINPGVKTVNHLEFDANGRLWVATPEELYFREARS